MGDLKVNKLKVKIWLGFRGRKIEEVLPIEMELPYDEKKGYWYFDKTPVFVFKNPVVLSIDSCIYEIAGIKVINWMERNQKEIYKCPFFEEDTLTIKNSKTYLF
jgi:hypothetical protein